MSDVRMTGRLTKNPELKKTNNGKSVLTVTVAVEHPGQEKPSYVPVVIWNKAAEFVAANGAKGSLVDVAGNFNSRSYETENGTQYVLEVVAQAYGFKYLEPKAVRNLARTKNGLSEIKSINATGSEAAPVEPQISEGELNDLFENPFEDSPIDPGFQE